MNENSMNRRKFVKLCAWGAGAVLGGKAAEVLADGHEKARLKNLEELLISRTGIKQGETKYFQVKDAFYRVSYEHGQRVKRGTDEPLSSLSILKSDEAVFRICDDAGVDGETDRYSVSYNSDGVNSGGFLNPAKGAGDKVMKENLKAILYDEQAKELSADQIRQMIERQRAIAASARDMRRALDRLLK